jgi:hypothetical protein
MEDSRVGRRTVARGALWSMPVVAVSVAAPAFAVSPTIPLAAFSESSCRCVDEKLYKLDITFTNNTGSTFLITGTSLTATLRAITFPPGQFANVAPGTSTATFHFTNSNNASVLQLAFMYTVRDVTTGLVTPDQLLSGTVIFPHCDECAAQSE